MSKLPELTLTKAGAAMLAKTPIGSEIPVTKWRIGDGQLPGGEDPRDRTQLVNPVRELPIASVENDGNQCLIKGQLVNTEMNAFAWRETGLYATDPDDGEILYAYGYEADGAEIPAGATQLREVEFGVELVFDNAANVTAVISKTLVFATLNDLDKKIDKLSSATAGHIPVVAAGGSLSDSGLTPSMMGVRPNLLDNWYFVGGADGNFPVNQRGVTVAETNGFGIDRWRCTEIGLAVSTDAIILPANAYLTQKIDVSPFIGRSLTMSLLLADGRFLTGSGVITNGAGVNFYWENGIRLYLESSTEAIRTVGINVTAQTKLKAVKLELGNSQTLASQSDDGSWNLLEYPVYAAELQKCQRYYEETAYSICYGVANSTTEIAFASSIKYENQKRISGTISVNPSPLQPLRVTVCDSTMGDIDGCVLMTPTAYNPRMLSPKILNEAGQFTVGQIYRIQVPDKAYIVDAAL